MRIWLLVVLLTAACQSNDDCEIDPEFKKQFDEKIKYLLASETDTSFLYQPTDKINVIYFLESVTGTKSQIYWGDVFSYQDRKSLNEDLTKWRKWYDDHKCEMTMVKADSLFRNYQR